MGKTFTFIDEAMGQLDSLRIEIGQEVTMRSQPPMSDVDSRLVEKFISWRYRIVTALDGLKRGEPPRCPACQKDPDPRGWSACYDCRKLNDKPPQAMLLPVATWSRITALLALPESAEIPEVIACMELARKRLAELELKVAADPDSSGPYVEDRVADLESRVSVLETKLKESR